MRRTILLLAVTVQAPAFAGSHVYAPLASSLVASLDPASGRQIITGTTGLNAQAFFVAPYGKSFFITSKSGLLHKYNPVTGRRVQFKTTYPVFTNFLSTTPFALTPDESRLLVGTCAVSYDGACIQGFVEIFETARAREIAVISFNGDEVTGIAASPDGQTAYVTHQYQFICVGCGARPPSGLIPSNAITAISIPTLAVGASLALQGGPGKLVLNPAGTLAYVTPAFGSGLLSAVNLPQLTLASQVEITGGVRIALTSDGSVLCATTSAYTSGGSNDTLTFYNAPSLSIIGTVSLPGYSQDGLVVDSAGQFAYVGNSSTGIVYKVSISALSLSASFPVGSPLDLALSSSGDLFSLSAAGASVAVFDETSAIPLQVIPIPMASYLTVSPDGGKIYLSLAGSGMAAISLFSGATLSTYFPGYQVFTTAITPDGSTVFAGGYDNLAQLNYFLAVDARSGEVKNQILSTGFTPTVTISANGTMVLVNGLNGAIGVYNVAKGTIEATIPLKAGGAVAINPAGTLAYIGAPYGAAPISVVDLTKDTVTGSIAVPCEAIVFSPIAPFAYAWGANTLSAIDTTTNAVIASISVKAGLGQSLAISPDGRYLYTSGAFGNTIDTYYPGSIIEAASLSVIGVMPTFSPLVAH